MEHGGDIYRNQADLDFSVNLNPLGTPDAVVHAVRNSMERLSVYPDPAQESVRKALAEWEEVSADNVIAGNGASELLLAIVRGLRPRRALLFEPAFTGYTHVLNAAGCHSQKVILRASEDFRIREDAFAQFNDFLNRHDSNTSAAQDLIILCNPANPTGMGMEEKILRTILDQAQQYDIPVLLDESFFLLSDCAEHADRSRSRRLIETYGSLFLVRSLTKIFAMPGIRAGYVLSRSDNILRLRAQLPEWNLSAAAEAAIVAGCRVLSDTDFAEKSREYIQRERDYLAGELQRAGLTIYKGEAPFLLLQGRETLFQELLKKKILIRDCSHFPGLGKGWFRIAVKDHAANETLIKRIREII